MKQFIPIIRTTRPAFLALAPICVLLGAATAVNEPESIHYGYLVLATLGALFAHISINTLNEYADFKSGLDLNTDRTPFSGGSGALPRYPELAHAVLVLGLLGVTATVVVGAYFVYAVGWGVVPVGCLGLLLVLAYTGFVTKHPWLCLLAPGFGFGILVVAGSAYVVSGRFSTLPLVAGLVPFFLTNNLLLLNQFPDIAADRRAGRRSFPIVYGTAASVYVYGAFLAAAALVVLAGVAAGILPMMALSAIVSLPLGLIALRGANTSGLRLGKSPIYLACNAAAAVIAPFALALSVLFAP